MSLLMTLAAVENDLKARRAVSDMGRVELEDKYFHVLEENFVSKILRAMGNTAWRTFLIFVPSSPLSPPPTTVAEEACQITGR